jgi:hypothetical protein
MPTFTRGDVSLYYEEHGKGFPLLMIAPGRMRSTVSFWGFVNPIHRSPPYRAYHGSTQCPEVEGPHRAHGRIARLHGRSTRVVDHLSVSLSGGMYRRSCIMGYQAARSGSHRRSCSSPLASTKQSRSSTCMTAGPRATGRAPGSKRRDVETFRAEMYGAVFVFSVSRDFVKGCHTPLLVLLGTTCITHKRRRGRSPRWRECHADRTVAGRDTTPPRKPRSNGFLRRIRRAGRSTRYTGTGVPYARRRQMGR